MLLMRQIIFRFLGAARALAPFRAAFDAGVGAGRWRAHRTPRANLEVGRARGEEGGGWT